MSIMLVMYGLAQPYKHHFTNIMEMVLQTIFIVLLDLKSTNFEDSYGHLLAPPEMINSTTSGISTIAKILLPIYYLPVFLLIIVATVHIFIQIR